MAEQENKKDSGKIRDQIGSGSESGKAKKKIVIKKKGAPQNKDITDLFKKDSQKQAAGKPKGPGRAAGEKPAETKKETVPPPTAETKRPAAKQESTPRPGSVSQGREGRPVTPGRPMTPSRHPVVRKASQQGTPPQRQKPAGSRPPSGEGSGPPSAPSFAGAGTPFDAVIESTRRAPGGGAGRKPHSKKTASEAPAQGQGRKGPERERTGVGGGRGGPPRSGGGRSTREDNYNRLLNKIEKRRPPAASGTTVPKQIEILESIQVGELAKKMNLKPGDVIARLMKMGEMVTINKTIDAETATLVAQEYDCEVKVVSLFDETVIEEEEDKVEDRGTRPPVVTIMGHVDHGKTKLLDTIRKSNVIDTEAGAITQHIGAYQVQTQGGKITFLDTPGHEAFTAMRARGAAVTDIVILVVAADDGVKEQTVEAIRHAQEAEVPIIVAINKVDLESANPDQVKQELVRYGLQPEDWGGSNIFCEISAKQNMGIEHLLEMILLQAEVMELQANPSVRAVGHVIEAKIDPGKGPVATILVEKGTLSEGDPYVVGIYSGRIRAMFNDLGRRVKTVGPATPVEITGIDGVPEAGDPFQVVETDKYGREVAERRQHYKQVTEAAQRAQPTLGDLRSWIQDHKELKVIIKADVQGSVEAIKDGLLKLSTDDVKVRVIHGATGAISESDVTLASASNAIIVGFQVRATPRALELADKSRVEIK